MKLDLKELKSINILYIEDEELIRTQTSNLFKNLFNEVFIASNGIEALEIYNQKSNIDIIVSDINMPKMGGLEFAEKLVELNNEIPIILTTAHTDEDFLLRSFELSISKYITKPLKIKELTQAIIDIVSKHKKHNKLKEATLSLANQTKNTMIENEKLKTDHDTNEKLLDFYKKLVDNFTVKITIDSKSTIKNVSNAFTQVYGYFFDEVNGKDATILSHNYGIIQKKMLEATKEKKAIEFKDKFLTKDSKVIECDCLIIPNYHDSITVSEFDIYQLNISC